MDTSKLTPAEVAQVASLRRLISRLARADGSDAMRQANDARAAIAKIHAGAR